MNPICVYDFTIFTPISGTEVLPEHISDFMAEIAKGWSFQLEKGEKNGTKHFQGRINLKTKARQSRVETLFKNKFTELGFKISINSIFISPTSSCNKGNDFYVTKEDTRIDGPWTDPEHRIIGNQNNPSSYVPIQIRSIEKLHPFQQTIVDSIQHYDADTINIVICNKGMEGKTTLCQYIDVYGLGLMVPPLKDYKQLMEYCMSFPPAKAYMIDMPRALNKENLAQFFSAIETIKGGFMFDTRFKGRRIHFDRPNIWVFTNSKPDLSLLTLDRWRLWTTDSTGELINFASKSIQVHPGK